MVFDEAPDLTDGRQFVGWAKAHLNAGNYDGDLSVDLDEEGPFIQPVGE